MEKKYTFLRKELEDRTEEEKELTKIILQRKTVKYLEAIDNNLKFFFWLTVISLGIYAIVLVYQGQ